MARQKASKGKRAEQRAPEQTFRAITPGEHLGDWGETDDDLIDATFGWCKTTFRVNPEVSDLSYIDFMTEIAELDTEDPRSIIVIKKRFEMLVHPDDFEQFWSASLAHRKKLVDLLRLEQGLMEALTGRPTGQASDSASGPPSTDTKSTDTSLARALQLESGRPDRALAIVRRHEELAAEAG